MQAKVLKLTAQQSAKQADAGTPGPHENAADSTAQEALTPEAQADAPPGVKDAEKDTGMRDDTAMADAGTGTGVAVGAAVDDVLVRCYSLRYVSQQWHEPSRFYVRGCLQHANLGCFGAELRWVGAPTETGCTTRTFVQVTDGEVKAAWLEKQHKVLEATLQTVERRRPFEVHLKRRWWSPLPMEPVQLLTWWMYLDAVESEGDATTMYGLFERCLVPCASYPGAFVTALSTNENQNAVKRACCVWYTIEHKQRDDRSLIGIGGALCQWTLCSCSPGGCTWMQ